MVDVPLDREVGLPAGRIRGRPRDAGGVLSFRGLPYAAPPVGPLRWRPPRPVEPWRGTLDAGCFGARCPGVRIPGYADRAVGDNEDCLTLNVWTAANTAGEKRPVMVWIHGGGFGFGSGALPINDGSALARAGVVLVTINYRLGIFGFLAHPELDAEDGPSGNLGLQDQIAALRWVRDNIASFGGDPGRVTIFGESAGAHAVGLLMVAPPTRGLFHRAIAQSGAWWDGEHGSIPTAAEARARGAEWIRRHGGGSIAAARALPAATVMRRSHWNFLLDPAVAGFAPSVDGHVVPDTPARLFERGEQADVPLMAGWNAMEESVFTPRGLPTRPAALRCAAAEMFGPNRVAANSALFPANRKEARRASDRITGDLVISEQVHAMLEVHARTASAGAWGYQFGHRSRFLPRAGHTAEIPFVFGTLDAAKGGVVQPARRDDIAMSDAMMSCWVSFADAGEPVGGGGAWPRYAGWGGDVMHFGPGPSQAGAERDTEYMRLIADVRSEGRLPDAWRGRTGRMSAAAAALVRPVLLAAVGLRSALRRRGVPDATLPEPPTRQRAQTPPDR